MNNTARHKKILVQSQKVRRTIIALIVALSTVVASSWLLRRWQETKHFKNLKTFEVLFQEYQENRRLTKTDVIAQVGEPAMVKETETTQLLIYVANDGLKTFLLYAPYVKIACKKSDGTVESIHLDSR